MKEEEKKPIWRRQREALHAFREAAAARAELEVSCEEAFRNQAETIEREYQEAQARFAAGYQEAAAVVEDETQAARGQIEENCEAGLFAAEEELAKVRQAAQDEYGLGKHRASADFQESRWTIT